MLSKQFLREKTPPLKKLPCLDERWYDSHKIETRFGTVVTQFNIDRRLAVLGNGETIEFKKACLAMGSRPVRPPVAGIGLGNVIYLRTIRDALALREMAQLGKNDRDRGRRIAGLRSSGQSAPDETEGERSCIDISHF